MQESDGLSQFVEFPEFVPTEARMRTRPFDFAGLPAEMREEIYGHALSEDTVPVDLDKHRKLLKETVDGVIATTPASTHLASSSATNPSSTAGRNDPDPPLVYAYIRNSPITNILLTNKQWKREYGAVARKARELVFTDHQKYNFTKFELPEHVRNITKVEFNLLLLCQQLPCSPHTDVGRCHAVHELRSHFTWIGYAIMQMPKLKRVRFYAHISHADFKLDGKTKRPCEPFVIQTIADVCKVAVVKHVIVYRYDSVKGERSLDGAKEKIFEWERGEVKVIQGKDDKADGQDEENKEEHGSEDTEIADAPSSATATPAGG